MAARQFATAEEALLVTPRSSSTWTSQVLGHAATAASASSRHRTTRWFSTFCIQLPNISSSVDQCIISPQPRSYSLTCPLFAQIPSPTDRSSHIPTVSRVKPAIVDLVRDPSPAPSLPGVPPSSSSGPCRESRIRTTCFSKLGPAAATFNTVRAPVWKPGHTVDLVRPTHTSARGRRGRSPSVPCRKQVLPHRSQSALCLRRRGRSP